MGNKMMLSDHEEGLITTPTNKQSPSFPSTSNPLCTVGLLGAGFTGKTTLIYQIQRMYELITPEMRSLLCHRIRFYVVEIACEVIELYKEKKQIHENSYLPKYCQDIIEFHDTCPNYAKLLKTPWQIMSGVFLNIRLMWKDQDFIDAWSLYPDDGCAAYFKQDNNLDRMGSEGYSPTDLDALKLRVKTVGHNTVRMPSRLMYDIIDTGGQRSERKKWPGVIGRFDVLVYVISLSDYNEVLYEDMSVNKMIEAIDCFSKTINMEMWKDKPVFIIFNKRDILEQKLKRWPMTNIFPDFTGGDDVEKCVEYIKLQFLSVVKDMDSIDLSLHEFNIIDTAKSIEFFTIMDDRCKLLDECHKLKKIAM